MSAVLTSPEDICNAALSRIGYDLRIGNMYEGSIPAKIGLDIYGQARDAALREGNWGFARRDVALTLLKSAPAGGYIGVTWSETSYPPLPWLFSYTYPSDCLKVRAIKPKPTFVPSYAPIAQVFDTPNDNSYTPAQKVIVCNVANAICTYTGQVTDPATWEVGFVEAFIAQLADMFAPRLNAQMIPVAATEEAAGSAAAKMERG